MKDNELVKLRGGPGKDYPCVNENVIECALSHCQRLGRCREGTTLPRKSNAHKVRKAIRRALGETVDGESQ